MFTVYEEDEQSHCTLPQIQKHHLPLAVRKHWEHCPSSPLEINLFSTVLALCRELHLSAFTNGISHQQTGNYKSSAMHCTEKKQQFSSKAIFFFPFHFTSFLVHVCTRSRTTKKIVFLAVVYCGKQAGFATRKTRVNSISKNVKSLWICL